MTPGPTDHSFGEAPRTAPGPVQKDPDGSVPLRIPKLPAKVAKRSLGMIGQLREWERRTWPETKQGTDWMEEPSGRKEERGL